MVKRESNIFELHLMFFAVGYVVVLSGNKHILQILSATLFQKSDLLSKVYINLIDQKEPKLNFNNENDGVNEILKTNISYFKKVIKPSEKEKKDHEQYLKMNLKKNFFN